MTRFLNYIIFHFIEFQKKVGNSDVSIFTTSIFFTIMVWMNILTIVNYVLMKNYYSTTNYIIPIILFCIVLFWMIYSYIKQKKYENFNFHSSFSGYLYLLFYIALSFILFVNSVELLKK
jgi:putative Mn2+ efflux pump MntP